jgi:hypothetical protein
VRAAKLGWVLDRTDDVEALLILLRTLAADRQQVATVAEAIDVERAFPLLETMWATYREHYKRLAASRGTAQKEAQLNSCLLDYVWRLLSGNPAASSAWDEMQFLHEQIQALKLRQQSPRYRLADSAVKKLQRVPGLRKIAWSAYQRLFANDV